METEKEIMQRLFGKYTARAINGPKSSRASNEMLADALWFVMQGVMKPNVSLRVLVSLRNNFGDLLRDVRDDIADLETELERRKEAEQDLVVEVCALNALRMAVEERIAEEKRREEKVQVIRCADCIFACRATTGHWNCTAHNSSYLYSDDDFCSFAQRRE